MARTPRMSTRTITRLPPDELHCRRAAHRDVRRAGSPTSVAGGPWTGGGCDRSGVGGLGHLLGGHAWMQSHKPERLHPTAGGAGVRTRQRDPSGNRVVQPVDRSAHVPRVAVAGRSSWSSVHNRITGPRDECGTSSVSCLVVRSCRLMPVVLVRRRCSGRSWPSWPRLDRALTWSIVFGRDTSLTSTVGVAILPTPTGGSGIPARCCVSRPSSGTSRDTQGCSTPRTSRAEGAEIRARAGQGSARPVRVPRHGPAARGRRAVGEATRALDELGADELVARGGAGPVPDLYFDTALSTGAATLPALLTFAQPGHIVFGSDWPFAGCGQRQDQDGTTGSRSTARNS